jgi:hypothetical protein
MTEHQVLFCPFCRECFEGQSSCPEHDLALVRLEQLGPDPLDPENSPEAVDERPLATIDPRFGRGWVAGAAVLSALAFLLEFVRGVNGTEGLTTRELAILLPSLWTLPLVTFTLLFILRRRRTPRALRSVRVLVPLVSLVTPATAAWALLRLHQGAAVWATGGRVIGMDVGPAVYVTVVAGIVGVIGGVRLGVLPRSGVRSTAA